MMRIKRKKLTKDKLIRVKPIRIPYKAFLIIKTSKEFWICCKHKMCKIENIVMMKQK